MLNITKNIKLDTKAYWSFCIVFCLFSLVAIMPEAMAAATANTSDAISGVLCKVVTKLTGQMGRGIATIAIIVLGIGLFLGKLSWAVAVATAIGIGLIFGSAQMVTWIGGSSTTTACS